MTFNFGLGMPASAATPLPGTFNLPIDYNPALTDMSFLNAAAPATVLPAMGTLSATQPSNWFDPLKQFISNTPWTTTTNEKGIKTQGLFDMGLGAAQGLMGAYLGFQNLGIAKDTLAQNKRQFDLNFASQQKLTNSRLADRQASRVAFDPNSTSVAAYMAKNGI